MIKGQRITFQEGLVNMREKFETELVKLNNALVEMGALCEDAISCAVKYLLDRDEQMKESSVMAEKLIFSSFLVVECLNQKNQNDSYSLFQKINFSFHIKNIFNNRHKHCHNCYHHFLYKHLLLSHRFNFIIFVFIF